MIIVTGATGCIGVNLTRALLEHGEKVAVMCRPAEDTTPLGDLVESVEVRHADVRDAEAVSRALRGANAVFHLAGIAIHTNTLAKQMREVNVMGTENVVRAAAEHGVRLVHTSSMSAIGLPVDGVVADEGFTFKGDGGSAYVATKRAGELVVGQYVERGADAVILNPAAVMAAGGDPNYGWPGFVQRVVAGRFKRYPSGGVAMVGGADLSQAYMKALKRGRSGQRYIVAGTNLPYRELIDLVAQTAGTDPTVGPIPDALIRVVARANAVRAPFIRNPVQRPLVVPENLPLLTRRLYYSGEKAHRELGVEYAPLAKAIETVVDWCRAQGTIPAK